MVSEATQRWTTHPIAGPNPQPQTLKVNDFEKPKIRLNAKKIKIRTKKSKIESKNKKFGPKNTKIDSQKSKNTKNQKSISKIPKFDFWGF